MTEKKAARVTAASAGAPAEAHWQLEHTARVLDAAAHRRTAQLTAGT